MEIVELNDRPGGFSSCSACVLGACPLSPSCGIPRFQKSLDGGYRDLQLTVRVGSGLMCELQMNTKFFLYVKDGVLFQLHRLPAETSLSRHARQREPTSHVDGLFLFRESLQETSGHRTFEVKRQLVADVTANDTGGTTKTLEWAAKQPEAVTSSSFSLLSLWGCSLNEPVPCSFSCSWVKLGVCRCFVPGGSAGCLG